MTRPPANPRVMNSPWASRLSSGDGRGHSRAGEGDDVSSGRCADYSPAVQPSSYMHRSACDT
jgi:hypothetical protein